MRSGELGRRPGVSNYHTSLWAAFLAGMLTSLMGEALTATARNKRAPAGADDHGRAANAPSEIPARGWKDVLWRVVTGISDDRVLANAAAVVFFALLALFPGIAALVSIYGLMADPQAIAALSSKHTSK